MYLRREFPLIASEIGQVSIGMKSSHALATVDPWWFWSKAAPLSQAYVRFAPIDKAGRYHELSETHSWPAIVGRVGQRMSEGAEGWGALRDSTLQGGELDGLRDELRSACFRYVHTGALKAYGFAIPRAPDDPPQPVPPDLWDGTVNWERSTLQGNGLKMEGVRLIPPHWEDQLVARQATATNRRGPGRRSREDHIREAFDALCKSGQIDFNRPMNRTFEPIRCWVLAKLPNDPDEAKGLNDKTIAKTIREDFNARKEGSKL